jgi:hypothetical protein
VGRTPDGCQALTLCASVAEMRWCRNPDSLMRQTPRSIVVSTAPSCEPVRLAGVAMLVWLCLADEQTAETLVDNVAERSALPPEQVEAAVLAALQRLADLGGVVAR